MFFTRRRTVPTGYTASNFLLTYFIIGLLILSLAFVFYTRQILQQNRNLVGMVPTLADLAGELPGVSDRRLQDQLNQIIKELLSDSRLSFIITDAKDERIIIARRIDEAIESKIDAELPLSPAEESKLQTTLERMKKKTKEPKLIHYTLEGHEISGYYYYGEADAKAIDQTPFVITDLNDRPQKWQIWGQLIKAAEATPEQYARAKGLIRTSKVQGRVFPLQANLDLRQGYLYYEVTPDYGIIMMPLVLAAVFSTFLIVGFLSYRRIKACEQASIWGGLAKETAHQLGTPISSLMGWVELLAERHKQKEDEATAEIYASMQGDLARLQNITARFGRIGAQPQKTWIDINTVIGDVVAYFQKRLPNRSTPVEIRVVSRELPEIFANGDLLQWVFENLIRNSLDAIDKETGVIEIDPRLNQPIWAKRAQITIEYKDNGKGIARKDRPKIFQPGMTTKKHGWGLGLTLVKRIVEEYHHGQIRLVETGREGTTFEIVLPVEPFMDEKAEGILLKGSLHHSRKMRLEERKKGG
ncbi:MAG: HAMP domain-containing sensor histidine kinase [Candidatus Poribacteria bacterium]|nr:HAMP domain-containing sensor histidine kinase [Candidatus Poribacteria bacterium]